MHEDELPEHPEHSEFQKMNPEIKAEWIAALRSGAYQQGNHKLQKGNNFCCLGVRCQLDIGKGLIEAKMDPILDDVVMFRETNFNYGSMHGNGWVTGIPDGITLERWGVEYGAAIYLTGLNDDKHFTFDEIARWIEINL